MPTQESIHGECRDNEVFIGNMPRSAFERLDWVRKRQGQICYDPDGHIIPQGGMIPEQRLVPVFIERDEFESRQSTAVRTA